MKEERTKKTVWIGLACVKQASRGGVLGDAGGAYVNSIGFAINDLDFRSEVERALRALNLELVSLEDSEPIASRMRRQSIDSTLYRIVEDVRIKGLTAFGTFHTFEEDSDE